MSGPLPLRLAQVYHSTIADSPHGYLEADSPHGYLEAGAIRTRTPRGIPETFADRFELVTTGERLQSTTASTRDIAA